MARFRLSLPAQGDIANILIASFQRWGAEGQRRYAAILTAALRQVAAEPEGPTTRRRDEIGRGIRSLHLRHVRGDAPRTKVRQPVHVLYYRAVAPGVIDIVRILHERMDPNRHV